MVIHTDHKAWTDLRLRQATGVIATWLDAINELAPTVVWIKGVRNQVADCLSRLFNPVSNLAIKSSAVPMLDAPYRLDFLQDLHSGTLGGHFGLQKTYAMARKQFFWPGMLRDVHKVLSECSHCGRNKIPLVDGRSTLTPILASYPWATIGVDLVGPITLHSGEKKMFLMVVDYFSKKVIAIPLQQTDGPTITRLLEQEVFWEHGVPEVLISDQGSNLCSDECDQFFVDKGISHCKSQAYHQQANGQVERMVQTFKKVLHSKLESRCRWKEALRQSAAAMNNSLVNSSTGRTPLKFLMDVHTGLRTSAGSLHILNDWFVYRSSLTSRTGVLNCCLK